jgi:hypothetical protein
VSTSKCCYARDSWNGKAVETTVELYAQPGETGSIRAWYDRVFGTFAFQTVPVTQEAGYSGTATDANGNPAANQQVTLSVGDRKFTTTTDSQGKYAFHSAGISRGKAILKVGSMTRNININKLTK